jgi:hypothetical protein
MTQGKLRYDLIPISSTLSLAQHVALVDEVGEDPVGGAFGDPDCGGDVPQSDRTSSATTATRASAPTSRATDR